MRPITFTWRRTRAFVFIALVAFVVVGAANASVMRETVPAADAVTFDQDDLDCLGEEVTLTGVVRVTVHVTLDSRGIQHSA